MVDKRKIIVIVGVAGTLGLMYYLGTKKKQITTMTTTTQVTPPTTTTTTGTTPSTTTTTMTGGGGGGGSITTTTSQSSAPVSFTNFNAGNCNVSVKVVYTDPSGNTQQQIVGPGQTIKFYVMPYTKFTVYDTSGNLLLISNPVPPTGMATSVSPCYSIYYHS